MIVAPLTAVMSIAIKSSAAMDVVVKSLSVVDTTAVPDEILTPLVLIELPEVGIAVPLATFQNLTVIVPESIIRLYDVMVQANGMRTRSYDADVVPAAKPADV